MTRVFSLLLVLFFTLTAQAHPPPADARRLIFTGGDTPDAIHEDGATINPVAVTLDGKAPQASDKAVAAFIGTEVAACDHASELTMASIAISGDAVSLGAGGAPPDANGNHCDEWSWSRLRSLADRAPDISGPRGLCAAGVTATVTQIPDEAIFTYATTRAVTLPTTRGASGVIQSLPGAAVGSVFQIHPAETRVSSAEWPSTASSASDKGRSAPVYASKPQAGCVNLSFHALPDSIISATGGNAPAIARVEARLGASSLRHRLS